MHTAGGLLQADLTVFSHTLVSADLSCSYLHQATPITAEEKRKRAKNKPARRETCVSRGGKTEMNEN